MTDSGEFMGRVEGKVAIVTGAASNPGLGYSSAVKLAHEGAKLVLTDIDDDGGLQCEAAIKAAGGEATYIHHDVTSEAEWKTVIAGAVSTYGKLDVLVNNAGIAVLKDLDDMTLEDFELQNRVNLTGPFLGIKYSVPEMRKAGGGSIINISSVAGLVGMPRTIAYGASKGGLRLMSKSVAMAVAKDNIRSNSVHPGVIWSNIYSWSTKEELEASPLADAIPTGKLGEADDIANAVLYLASDESKYVSGTEIVVDAGMTAR
jgi:NAD(P)-dependent dehydrogenase (short-subunit alcohol dehydrogenase family)